MALWGEPQFSTVGDTFPVGCRPDKSIVFDAELFKENPDPMDRKNETGCNIEPLPVDNTC
jgi:inositol oxygenase